MKVRRAIWLAATSQIGFFSSLPRQWIENGYYTIDSHSAEHLPDSFVILLRRDDLKQLGLVVSDDEKASEILSDIGFYRLGFYLFPFEKKYPAKAGREYIVRFDEEIDGEALSLSPTRS